MLSKIISDGFDLHSYLGGQNLDHTGQASSKLEILRPPYSIPAYLSEKPDLFDVKHNPSKFDQYGTRGVQQGDQEETDTSLSVWLASVESTWDELSQRGRRTLGGDATGLHVQTLDNGFQIVTLHGACDDLPRMWPPDGAASPGCVLPEGSETASWRAQYEGDDAPRPVLVASLWAPDGCHAQSCVQRCSDQCVWVHGEAANACALHGNADLVLHTWESAKSWDTVVKPQRQMWAVAVEGYADDAVHASLSEHVAMFDFVADPQSFPQLFAQPADACTLCEHVREQVHARCASPSQNRKQPEGMSAHVLIMLPQQGHTYMYTQDQDFSLVFRTQGFDVGEDGSVIVEILGSDRLQGRLTVEHVEAGLTRTVLDSVTEWVTPMQGLSESICVVCVCVCMCVCEHVCVGFV